MTPYIASPIRPADATRGQRWITTCRDILAVKRHQATTDALGRASRGGAR